MIVREAERRVNELIQYFPCVALVGPRQVGKTTLIKQIISKENSNYIYLDLENPADFEKLNDALPFFNQFSTKTIVIDEVQRRKELFPILRSVIDNDRRPGKFLLLGSASPDLIRDSSESLAGRIAYLELFPINILEIAEGFPVEKLWFNGGFPDAFTGKVPWYPWMDNFVRTYIEKDLNVLGFPGNSLNAKRLWQMLSHLHGNLLNYSELSKSMELDVKTVISYIQFLEKAFLIRVLQPYHVNIKKRVVKSPKTYLRDSGILHYFLGLEKLEELFGHPKMGNSWEGFVIEQIIANAKPNRNCYFYRTHDGSEIDLIIEKGGYPFAAIEIKFGTNFTPSRGNTIAIQTLNTKQNYIVIKDNEDFIHKDFRVCGIELFLKKYLPEI